MCREKRQVAHSALREPRFRRYYPGELVLWTWELDVALHPGLERLGADSVTPVGRHCGSIDVGSRTCFVTLFWRAVRPD